MDKKLVSAMILVLILLVVFGATFNIQRVKASGTIYIKVDGSVYPPTRLISSSDNITYYFTDDIYDSIVIERDNIVVDGTGYTIQGAGSGIGLDLSNRNNVTVRNMKAKGFDYSIYLYDSSNNNISENSVTNNNIAIYLSWSSNNSISQNDLIQNGDGVWLRYSSNNTLAANNIASNWGGILLFWSSNNTLAGNNLGSNQYGIRLHESSENTLSKNMMNGNEYNLSVEGYSFNDFINSIYTSNLVNGKPVYYFINQMDMEINSATYPEVGYLALINCVNITIEALDLASNTQGLQLAYTNNSKITANNIANNQDGIRLLGSSNNTLAANNIANNGAGILLEQSINNALVRNNIKANDRDGTRLFESLNNALYENSIITNKWAGIRLENSSNNSIYHNNFENNVEQVHANGSTNFWNDGYPSGGNYWSDYNVTDLYNGLYQNVTGSDGVGDTPFIIDANNVDNYPLKGTFSDFNATQEYHVQVICNSTISDFRFDGDTISFNVSGENETVGFCRVCIPTALMNGTYKVFVNGTEIPHTLLPFSNGTHSYLYFTYVHSTKEVVVIPEFSSAILILFMAATLHAVTIYRRKDST